MTGFVALRWCSAVAVLAGFPATEGLNMDEAALSLHLTISPAFVYRLPLLPANGSSALTQAVAGIPTATRTPSSGGSRDVNAG